jgi:hypothetical protein
MVLNTLNLNKVYPPINYLLKNKYIPGTNKQNPK